MKTIRKYELQPDQDEYELPDGAEILSAGSQGMSIFVWALVEPSNPKTLFYFQVHGTGHDVEAKCGKLKFIDTVFVGDHLVFHVFQRINITY